MNKNEFYLVSIEYGRDLALECSNCDYCFISNNKNIIIREFIQGVKDELEFNDLIIENGKMSLDDVKKELSEAIDKKQDYRLGFYKNIDDFDNGCERFIYACVFIERKEK